MYVYMYMYIYTLYVCMYTHTHTHTRICKHITPVGVCVSTLPSTCEVPIWDAIWSLSAFSPPNALCASSSCNMSSVSSLSAGFGFLACCLLWCLKHVCVCVCVCWLAVSCGA